MLIPLTLKPDPFPLPLEKENKDYTPFVEVLHVFVLHQTDGSQPHLTQHDSYLLLLYYGILMTLIMIVDKSSRGGFEIKIHILMNGCIIYISFILVKLLINSDMHMHGQEFC